MSFLFFLEDGNNDHTESVYPCPYPLFCRRCPDSSLIQREFNEQMWQAGPHRLYSCLGKTSALASPPRLQSFILFSSTMPNARVLRDIKARHGVAANEIVRRAYLMVARNETLSPQVRHHAQLQLNTFGRYTRPTTVRNRCHESGRGRGIMSEFGLSRVRHCCLLPVS